MMRGGVRVRGRCPQPRLTVDPSCASPHHDDGQRTSLQSADPCGDGDRRRDVAGDLAGAAGGGPAWPAHAGFPDAARNGADRALRARHVAAIHPIPPRRPGQPVAGGRRHGVLHRNRSFATGQHSRRLGAGPAARRGLRHHHLAMDGLASRPARLDLCHCRHLGDSPRLGRAARPARRSGFCDHHPGADARRSRHWRGDRRPAVPASTDRRRRLRAHGPLPASGQASSC